MPSRLTKKDFEQMLNEKGETFKTFNMEGIDNYLEAWKVEGFKQYGSWLRTYRTNEFLFRYNFWVVCIA